MAAHLKAVALDRLIAWGRGSLMRQVVRVARGLACTVGLVVASGVSWAQSPGFAVSGAGTTPSVPQAVGLIVKLRDAGATRASVGSQAAATGAASVVRIAASRMPSDSAESQRQRLTQALQRRGVRHLGHRATAFAARALRFDAPMSREQAQLEAQRLRADPDVEWVVVDEVLRPQAAYVGQFVEANLEKEYRNQAWLQPRAGLTDRYGLADFPAAWGKLNGRTLTPVTVAVLDSGVPPASEWANADLDGRMWPGYDFVSSALFSRDGGGLDADPTDPGDWLTQADFAAIPEAQRSNCAVRDSEWHGLGVSYVLAAVTGGNHAQGAGALAPLPGQVLLPVRVGGTCGAAMSDIIEGMLWAAGVSYQGQPGGGTNPHPARVINLSFGADGDCADTQVGSQDWLYLQTLASLAQKGALVVASVGNGDPKTGLGLTSATRPASCAGVLAATGLNGKGFKAGYANFIARSTGHFGVAVASGDIVQLTGDMWQLNDAGFSTLTNSGRREPVTGEKAYSVTKASDGNMRVGTSYAAPQAAAVAALMLAVEPRLTVSELLGMITDQVQPFLPVSGYPTCSAKDSNTGHCNCTSDTCGSGVLDAGLAVQKAIDHADAAPVGGSIPGSDPVVSTFTPDRGAGVGVAQPSGSGGGGAVDDLACMALVTLALAVTWARRRPHHATQA